MTPIMTTASSFDERSSQSINHNIASSNANATSNSANDTRDASNGTKLTVDELIKLVKKKQFSDEEIVDSVIAHKVSIRRLESIFGAANAKRCVDIRRLYYNRELESQFRANNLEKENSDISNGTNLLARNEALSRPQSDQFEYDKVYGACCENVIGYVRLPVGLAGPLLLDTGKIYVPMATTEGCLVASTQRGMLALNKGGGVVTNVVKNRMTRAPIIEFRNSNYHDDLKQTLEAMKWLEDPKNKERMRVSFSSNSRHTTLIDYSLKRIFNKIHIRFEAETGDAMGMNMCSKGAELALKELQKVFPTMHILTLSGNMCTDKKPSAINWICGRGKSVESNAIIPAKVVQEVLKTDVDTMIKVWTQKVMVGSALAGSIGGFNAHAANVVTAIFIATGQDVAQSGNSSNCLLTLEKVYDGALAVQCSMPSIECGTVGGGTVLSDQSGYLQLMGIKGPTVGSYPSDTSNRRSYGEADGFSGYKSPDVLDGNATKLARIVCSAVMAAELSLIASLADNTLVKSHMTHNRSTQPCKVV